MRAPISPERTLLADLMESNNVNRFRARKAQAERAAGKGRTGRIAARQSLGRHGQTQSLPSGQPVTWVSVARSVVALSGLMVLLGALVALQVGKAVIHKGRGR